MPPREGALLGDLVSFDNAHNLTNEYHRACSAISGIFSKKIRREILNFFFSRNMMCPKYAVTCATDE